MHHAQKERRTLPPLIEPGQYRIAGKFGGQKICQIVLEAKKIKIWRNLNLANSCRRTSAHTQTRTYVYVFLVT